MDFYMDTAAPVTSFVKWAHVAPFQPERRQVQQSLPVERPTYAPGATDFFDVEAGPAAPTPQLTRRPNGLVASTVTRTLFGAQAVQPAEQVRHVSSEGESIAKQRVRLMAARYATGDNSSELMARLEILSRRLSEHIPRVSLQQVQALEAASAQVVQVRKNREERMKRLSLGA